MEPHKDRICGPAGGNDAPHGDLCTFNEHILVRDGELVSYDVTSARKTAKEDGASRTRRKPRPVKVTERPECGPRSRTSILVGQHALWHGSSGRLGDTGVCGQGGCELLGHRHSGRKVRCGMGSPGIVLLTWGARGSSLRRWESVRRSRSIGAGSDKVVFEHCALHC